MSRPIVRIHNTETNEIIDREMNDTEFAEYNKMLEILTQEEVDRNAKIAQRAALLERLGITEEEARILLGGN
jgi:hypothetical protein